MDVGVKLTTGHPTDKRIDTCIKLNGTSQNHTYLKSMKIITTRYL